MEFDEEFYSPRPPIKQPKSNPRIKRATFKEKSPEKEISKNENEEIYNQVEKESSEEYTMDSETIAARLLSGSRVGYIIPELIPSIKSIIESKRSNYPNDFLDEIISLLDDMNEDAIKTEFQQKELSFLKIEIGHAKTDYKIFKHKMLSKEADLLSALEEQIEDIKERHQIELEECNDDSVLPDLIAKQEKELQDAENSAEIRIQDFHKFIEAELSPYKAKLKSLKAQEEIAQDKERLWRTKHPISTQKGKASLIVKPDLN